MAAESNELLRVERTESAKPPVIDSTADVGPDNFVLDQEPEQTEPTQRIRWQDNHRKRLASIGIEFDGQRLTVVGLYGRGRKKRFGRLARCEWPKTPSRDALISQLRGFMLNQHTPIHLVLSTPRGIVRRYLIPQLPRAKRRQAAIWEGKQLVPFPLDYEHALFGFHFQNVARKQCQVTLVALPRSDAGGIIEALLRIGIPINSIVLSGTQNPPRYERGGLSHPEGIDAVVLCSPSRAAFVAFAGDNITFHYDLGALPVQTGSIAGTQPQPSDNAFSWIFELRPMISDALDFFTSSHPNVTLTHLHVVGMDESLAPHLTELAERFTEGIEVVNPLLDFSASLPDDFQEWIRKNIGAFTPASLAAAGRPAIDLSPSHLRCDRWNLRLIKYARTAFIVSLAVIAAVTGLLVQHLLARQQAVDLARRELHQLQNSPPVQNVTGAMTSLIEYQAFASSLDERPERWMPWLKTMFATMPLNCRLDLLTVEPTPVPDAEAALRIRLAGSLSPESTPHAVNYHSWLTDLERLAGPGNVELADERRINWKGRTRSAFTIILTPPRSRVLGENR